MTINSIIKSILAILLLLCLFNMPYGFYQLVRFVATFFFSYLAFTANKENLKNQVFIYIALVLLFQPFLKISLGRMIWNVVDAVVAIGLIVSLASSKKTK